MVQNATHTLVSDTNFPPGERERERIPDITFSGECTFFFLKY